MLPITEMRIIKRGYKTELDLSNHQKTACERHAEAARFAYNWGLQRKTEAYRAGQKTPNYYELRRELTALKKTELARLYQVSKCVPDAALANLDKAFAHFFRRVKEKKAGKRVKVGYPKFKRRNRSTNFQLYGTIIVYSSAIQLPRLGRLRLKETGYLPTGGVKIYHATVSKRADRWFVSINVEFKYPAPLSTGRPAVGVDLGISRLATMSDGTFIENPRPLQRNIKKLSRMSKIMSRRKQGGANWHKVVRRAANLYLHVSNVRNNVLHHATTYLAKTKSVIALEDLNVRGMMSNRSLAQSIADAGWFEFRQQLAYKSDWYGASIVMADRFFPSTKRCSNCGALKSDISLDERIYQCDYCGIVIDRDLNAAKNLEQLITASSAGL